MNKLRIYFPLPLLPLVALPVILFAPFLLTGKAIFWGTPALQFVPWRDYGWELLSKGQAPLWNHLLGMGAPLAANYQSAFFYPPNWIEGLFWAFGGVAWQAWSQTMLVVIHLVWAGAGMTLLLRRLGTGLLGQTIGGMAFGCAGYLVARSGFLSINASAAWLPWILLGTWLIFARPHDRLAMLGLVLALAMQLLAGHAQTAWYTFLLAGLWAGFWGWWKASHQADADRNQTSSGPADNKSDVSGASGLRAGWASVLAAWGRLGAALLLAIGLAAIQLLPTAEYLLQSQRASAVDFEMAMTYSFWPWRLLGLFAPDLFGNPAHGDYWGYANYWEDAFYIGLLPAILALAVLLRPGRWPHQASIELDCWVEKPLASATTRRSLVGFLLAVIVVGFLLALGKNTPLFPWLYQHVPTFSMFNAPSRYLIWIEICLVLLAGMGADRWRRPEGRGLYWTRLAAMGGFAVTLGAGLAWYLMRSNEALQAIELSAISATALAGMWGLLVGLFCLTAPRAQTPPADLYKTWRQRAWLWGVICMLGLDLIVAGWGLNPGVDLEFYSQTPATWSEVSNKLGSGRLYLPEDDEAELKFKRFLRFDTFYPGEEWSAMRAVMLPNLSMLVRAPSANNFDPLLAGRYVRWMEFLSQAKPLVRADWLNLMAVSVVETVDTRSPGGVRFDSAASIAPEAASKSDPSRYRFIPCARLVPDGEAAWQLMVSGMLDIGREVVIETQGANPETNCLDADWASVEALSEIPTVLRYRVNTSHAGWLVLADQWYPGWSASVDSQPVEIQRANYLFRAVRVDAGNHQVEFRYRPTSFMVGFGLTLFTMIGLALYSMRLRFQRK